MVEARRSPGSLVSPLPPGSSSPVASSLFVVDGPLTRFVIVGLLAMVLDLGTYRLALWIAIPVALAKSGGFATGTTFAYFVNRSWTFNVSRARVDAFVRFAALYLGTLIVNVGINASVLGMLGRGEIPLALAFVAATATSATLNFIGLRFLVFAPDRAVSPS